MNADPADMFDQQSTTIEATGSELLNVCADARAGLLTILGLKVQSNGRYQIRVMSRGKVQSASEATV
jgi:hypothetical protein